MELRIPCPFLDDLYLPITALSGSSSFENQIIHIIMDVKGFINRKVPHTAELFL